MRSWLVKCRVSNQVNVATGAVALIPVEVPIRLQVMCGSLHVRKCGSLVW